MVLKPLVSAHPVTAVESPKLETVSVEIIQGKAHHVRGEIHEALRCYKQSILKHPQSSLSYFHLGEAFLALKKLPAALRAYCTGLKLSSSYHQIPVSPPLKK